MPSEEQILEALKRVKYPGYTRDIVSFGLVKRIATRNSAVHVEVEVTSNDDAIGRQIKSESETAIKNLPDATSVLVEVKQTGGATAGGAANPWAGQSRLGGIGRLIAVASGKGGVGKSTVSVNLACALKYQAARVGLLDCDIYGPSIPLMMGVRERPTVSPEEKLVPPENYGIKLMSMGFMLEGDQPVIWRGPMIMKTIQQFIHSVDWGELDYLLIDLPPGTGDAQLSLCQTVPLDGGIVVTTPQEASLGVVRKGIAMFEKVNVPILGIVENMSYFTAPNGEEFEIFGRGGGKAEAERRNLPFLGEVPLFTEIRVGGDSGRPVVVNDPKSQAAVPFLRIADSLKSQLATLH